MPFSRNPARYSDVRQVLDKAIEHGGARYSLSSHKAAVNWRFRAYTFMKLMADLAKETKKIPGQMTPTVYDNLVLSVDAGSPTVLIEARKIEGVLELNSETPLPGVDLHLSPILSDDDPLVEEARRIGEDL